MWEGDRDQLGRVWVIHDRASGSGHWHHTDESWQRKLELDQQLINAKQQEEQAASAARKLKVKETHEWATGRDDCFQEFLDSDTLPIPLDASSISATRTEHYIRGYNGQCRDNIEILAGAEIAQAEQQHGLTKPVHWKKQPQEIEVFKGYKLQWIGFYVERTEAQKRGEVLTPAASSLEEVKKMRHPKRMHARRIKQWAAGVAATWATIYGTNIATTEAELFYVAPRGMVVTSTPTPSVDVKILVDPVNGCTFNYSNIPVKHGGLIRFTSSGPVNLRMVEDILKPTPLVPDKDTEFAIDGSVVVRLEYPNDFVLPRPQLRFECDGKPQGIQKEGPSLFISPRR